ncbi:hypothetical protein EMIT0111MI5_110029 [Burkholderia sp. IT-111MI5]
MVPVRRYGAVANSLLSENRDYDGRHELESRVKSRINFRLNFRLELMAAFISGIDASGTTPELPRGGGASRR